jgi:hypothetical protein
LLIFLYGDLDVSVEQKSTKEKYMKKKFIIILTVLFTFCFAFIGCDDPPVETDIDLNGTWINDGNKYEFYFENGDYTKSYNDDTPYEKGTFTTDENKITIQKTEIIYVEGGNLVSRDGLIEFLKVKGEEITAEELNELFPSETIPYFIDGKKLFLFYYYDDEDGVNVIRTDTYTKK